MPLLTGKKSVGYNVAELETANKSKPPGKKRSRGQILAIALNAARKK